MKDQINRSGMILDIEPITDILTRAIDREGLTLTDIINEERDELLRILIGTVVIGAVRHQRR